MAWRRPTSSWPGRRCWWCGARGRPRRWTAARSRAPATWGQQPPSRARSAAGPSPSTLPPARHRPPDRQQLGPVRPGDGRAAGRHPAGAGHGDGLVLVRLGRLPPRHRHLGRSLSGVRAHAAAVGCARGRPERQPPSVDQVAPAWVDPGLEPAGAVQYELQILPSAGTTRSTGAAVPHVGPAGGGRVETGWSLALPPLTGHYVTLAELSVRAWMSDPVTSPSRGPPAGTSPAQPACQAPVLPASKPRPD